MLEMKRLFLWLTSSLLLADPLSQGERDRAMSALHASRKALIDAVSGLSEAQVKFKATPAKWSIAEITEHVAATEPFLMGFHDNIMKTPAAPEKRELAKGNDEKIMKSVAGREQKIDAPPALAPKSVFPTVAAALEAFKNERIKTIRYVQTTDAPMRDRFADKMGPEGKPADAYQMILLLASHTDRHVAQINEVKADAGYPKK